MVKWLKTLELLVFAKKKALDLYSVYSCQKRKKYLKKIVSKNKNE